MMLLNNPLTDEKKSIITAHGSKKNAPLVAIPTFTQF